MKKDTYYFSHDANAKDDPKCMLLIDQLGLEGYGIFWVLVETLRSQPDYKCPMNIVPSLARRFNTTAEKMKAVILGYDLFGTDETDVFFSESLLRRMELSDAKRLKLSEAGKRGYAIKSGLVQPPLNEDEASLKQLNKIKLNETKSNQIKLKENNIDERKLKFAHSLKEFTDIYGREMIKEFYGYWTEPNKSNTKFKQEMQKTWDLKRRLETWANNQKNFGKAKTENTFENRAANLTDFANSFDWKA